MPKRKILILAALEVVFASALFTTATLISIFQRFLYLLCVSSQCFIIYGSNKIIDEHSQGRLYKWLHKLMFLVARAAIRSKSALIREFYTRLGGTFLTSGKPWVENIREVSVPAL